MLSLCGDILGTKEADEQTEWFMLKEQNDAKQNGPSGSGWWPAAQSKVHVTELRRPLDSEVGEQQSTTSRIYCGKDSAPGWRLADRKRREVCLDIVIMRCQ